MTSCHLCGQPATVHLTDIVNRKKRHTHLCESCAHKQNIISEGPAPQLNLQPLLQLIMGQMGLLEPEAAVDPAGLTCPDCGLRYAQFKADGRLGCPTDYDAFRPTLEPLLERIHRGLYHSGKAPRAAAIRQTLAANVAELKRRLATAVAEEKYEEAARLRDAIRAKDTPA